MNIEDLTEQQLYDFLYMLDDWYDCSDVTRWMRYLMDDVERELQKRFSAGASKPRAKIVNRIPILTMREPLKKHGQEYYGKSSHNIVHASYHRGIRYVHQGLYADCLECGPDAW